MQEAAANAESARRPERMGGAGAILSVQIDEAHRAGEGSHTVILVEGVSDQRAIEGLTKRRGRDIAREGIAIIPIAGATNISRFLELLGPHGYDVRLAGLCDEGETGPFRRALQQAGLGSAPTRSEMERLGFYVCVRDLEDELIRALGVATVEAIIEEAGEMRAFRSFQNQPAQRSRAIERQLWRWMGNRKIRYARRLVDALDLEKVPRPLDGVLAHV